MKSKNDSDYMRIFNENVKLRSENTQSSNKKERDINFNKETPNKTEKRKLKEKRFVSTFFIQSVVCLIIICSIIFVKYMTPNTFVSVSSAINGLSENNITLRDLNRMIDERISANDTLAAFFNISPGITD